MERKENSVLRIRRKKQVSSYCGITVRERRILRCPVQRRGWACEAGQGRRLEGGKE